MQIAVASGKGGTGKTTVTASLARVWPGPLLAVDLDVEEPNLHLFLHPEFEQEEQAILEIPIADEEACTACGQCAELCQFKAINLLGEVLLTFSDMCHGCGGCLAVCPSGALSPGERQLGLVRWGRAGAAGFLEGRLRVGEAMSPPLMRAVRRRQDRLLAETPADVLVDAPPGVSCPAMTAVAQADALVLVTEPTPFGLYDLKLAVEAFGAMDRPMCVVLNRAGVGDRGVQEFCAVRGIPIAAEIPYSRRAAEAYSNGLVLAEAEPEMGRIFRELCGYVRDMAAGSSKVSGEGAAHA